MCIHYACVYVFLSVALEYRKQHTTLAKAVIYVYIATESHTYLKQCTGIYVRTVDADNEITVKEAIRNISAFLCVYIH